MSAPTYDDAVSAHLRTLDGTYNLAALKRLTWPVAWTCRSAETDACDAARLALVAQARVNLEAQELIHGCRAVALIQDGEIAGIELEDGGE